jgi:tRNA(Ile)-lysidine synthase
MPNALPEAAFERFRTTVDRLTGQSPARLGVAVSGGADSLALLLLCHAAYPDRMQAATVDHGLRHEAAGEASHVKAICESYGIPHDTLTLSSSPDGNVSDWARKERYSVLETWARTNGLGFVMTGHHADDQLETLVMRINRGAGIGGLAGIRPRNGHIVRPLLDWRRHELEMIVEQAGLQPVDDPTNRDDRFDRARLRKMLKSADWLDPIAATRSAAALAEAEASLEWTADAYFRRRVAESNGVVSFDHRDLPAELLRRLTLRCLRTITPDASPRGEEIDRLMDGLLQGRVATLANVRCTGGDFWLFAVAPPRRKI